ncbi:Alpha/Beta hydrolase protein [Aspergillus avenaceus]|uniref:Carboxylic ester hydrolase n=1 Tax=Aspergillus avenaceus TaxID=36643 RepID=A0A5N6U6Y2_ASPAV|nr:Alpha/Beta hydrolase protein [Aspergillus avenaceus]
MALRTLASILLWPAVRFGTQVPNPHSDPTITIPNGTLIGTHNTDYNQDLFLGIPYAEPPVGPLRFNRPSPINKQWDTPLCATHYGSWCHSSPLSLPGFTQPGFPHTESEDCLTLNIIRPSNPPPNIPVLVYIHGGGLQEGGSADQRYNLSFIVDESVQINNPIIAVSFNYRVSGFGFLSGQAIHHAKAANLGLHDQRLALRWVKENIAAFGGDPARITIQGESSGALSVGYQILAPGGENLFRAAIAQSGSPLSSAALAPPSEQDHAYNTVVHEVGCAHAQDTLHCLRHAPAHSLKTSFQGKFFFPVLDNDLIPDFPSTALRKKRFNTPLLLGSNTNEGTGYIASGEFGAINTIPDFRNVITSFGPGKYLSNATLENITTAYLSLSPEQIREDLGTVLPSPGPEYGKLYGLSTFYLGDYLVNAGKRYTARMWAAHGVPVYSYRFNISPFGVDRCLLGAAHFQEVAFTFRNLDGVGYAVCPFDGERGGEMRGVSVRMARMWICFVNWLDPNCGIESEGPEWPEYRVEEPVNMVFSLGGVSVERDSWHGAPIDSIIEAFDEYRF